MELLFLQFLILNSFVCPSTGKLREATNSIYYCERNILFNFFPLDIYTKLIGLGTILMQMKFKYFLFFFFLTKTLQTSFFQFLFQFIYINLLRVKDVKGYFVLFLVFIDSMHFSNIILIITHKWKYNPKNFEIKVVSDNIFLFTDLFVNLNIYHLFEHFIAAHVIVDFLSSVRVIL